MKYDILIAGVGGQGTVLASRLLAAAAMKAGYFARTSETIGMAQRGGCVTSHVRIDSENRSPLIPLDSADLLIGFEMAEAARNLPRLSSTGKCIVNEQVIKPITTTLGNVPYEAEQIKQYIQAIKPGAVFADAYKLAHEAGSVKAVNIVLLGIAAAKGYIPFEQDILKTIILENVPPKYMDLNLKAFESGLKYLSK